MFPKRLVVLGLLLVLVLAGNVYPEVTSNRGRLVVDPDWPHKPEGVEWGAVPGITVDSHDQVYVFNRNQPAIQVYRVDGTWVRSWEVPNPSGAHHVRLDPQGNVWLTDFRHHVVHKFSSEGQLLQTLGEAGQSGDGEGRFGGPTDKAFLPDGRFFVADGYGNRRVARFDAIGRFLGQWGEDGTEPGQFALPHAIVIDSTGRVYVADRNNARIQIFDTSGHLLDVWDDRLVPWGLEITEDDHLWVCGSSAVPHPDGTGWTIAPPPDQVVMKRSRAGEILFHVELESPTTSPSQPGQVDWVHGIAADSQGNLYLSDIQGQRAQKFVVEAP